MQASIAALSRKQISDFFSKKKSLSKKLQECEAEAERITGHAWPTNNSTGRN